MAEVVDGSLLGRGRDALGRHAWAEAYEALSEADRQGSLDGEGLNLLSQAAYWTGRPDETLEGLERSFGAYMEADDALAASMTAYRVAEQHGMRLSFSQAQGWAARAARLAGENPEWPVNGWLLWMQGLMGWFQGDYEGAIASYERALEFAGRSGDRELRAMSLHDKGHALCMLGRVAEGMGLLDEVMAEVVGGELDPEAAGYVYCGMIGVCSKLGDYGRAAEWTDATLRWCERQSIPAFTGVCRIHRAELLRIHGSLTSAEEEARRACEELPRFNLTSSLGPANYEIGEVRRRLGDFRSAEEAYVRATEYGHNPEPGLSLLRLAQGKIEAAAAGIRQALAVSGADLCMRIRLLAAQAEIALAAGDAATAGSAEHELESIAGEFHVASLQALAAGVRGAVLLAGGDAAGALPDLRAARQRWQDVEAPYEVAELRLLLAKAHLALGEEEAARMEARAARDAFDRLGARPAADAAGAFLGELAAGGESRERISRAFVFTDIVKSTDLVSAIGDEAWEGLLAWHDQALRSLFASHGGQVAHHTGDGFFVAFDGARPALTCAVAVQRALAEHRRAHGFAPLVRIGVHVGEATRRGQDYSGVEVHRAARVASLAEGGEILATADAVADSGAGSFGVSNARTVSVKGITGPVEVMTVAWRRGAPSQPE